MRSKIVDYVLKPLAGVAGGVMVLMGVGLAADVASHANSVMVERAAYKIERTDNLIGAREYVTEDSKEGPDTEVIPGMWSLVSIEEDGSEYLMAFNMRIGDCFELLAPMRRSARERGSPRTFRCDLQER